MGAEARRHGKGGSGRGEARGARGAGDPGRVAWVWWVLGGALLALGFQDHRLAPCVVPGLVGWTRGMRDSRRPVRDSYLGCYVFVFLALSWLHHTSTFILIAAAAYFALYGVLLGLLGRALHGRLGAPLWLAAPLAILAVETLVEHLTLFPVTWLHFGLVAWKVPPLTQVAELGGIQLVSAQLFLLAAALHHLGERRRALRARSTWLPLVAGLGSLLLSAGYGAWRLARLDLAEGPRVALVQGNIPQDVRNLASNAGAILERHVRLSLGVRDRGVLLVAWPESTSSRYPERDEPLASELGGLARRLDAYLLVGAVGLNAPPAPPSNSAFLFDPEGRLAGRSDKRILVPFAETLPVLRHIPPVRDRLSDLLSRTMHFRPHMTPGRGPQLLQAGGRRFGVLICYGDAVPFPADRIRQAGGEFLLTISNEAWFGAGELEQHLAMATIRSVETRLPMGRATNTGRSAVIDPAGRVVEVLPADHAGVLVRALPVTGLAPVPWQVRRGVQLGGTGLVLLLGLAGHLRRARHPPRSPA